MAVKLKKCPDFSSSARVIGSKTSRFELYLRLKIYHPVNYNGMNFLLIYFRSDVFSVEKPFTFAPRF
jgi:hypothetical protein